jgi:hypothetical protein
LTINQISINILDRWDPFPVDLLPSLYPILIEGPMKIKLAKQERPDGCPSWVFLEVKNISERLKKSLSLQSIKERTQFD